MTTIYQTMWTKQELEKQMVKAGWQPGSVDGRFVHRETGAGIDINERGKDGRVIWLTRALACAVPGSVEVER